jgi:hypothetical protein
MLKQILSFFLVCVISLQSYETIPEKFTVTERLFSWATAFDIEVEGYSLGTVERRMLSQAPLQYDLFDRNHYLIAQGTMRWFTFGAVFDVTDWNRNLIGTVEEEIFSFLPAFNLFSPFREKLAEAKMNFWGTQYTVTEPVSGLEIATLTRPFFAFNSQWTVTITNPELFAAKNISPTLFILVMAFQTDLEYWQHYQSQAIASFNASASLAPKTIEGREIRDQLKAYRQEVKGIVPTEQDFASVETVVEAYFTDKSKPVRFKTLTLEEKAALSHLIDQVY